MKHNPHASYKVISRVVNQLRKQGILTGNKDGYTVVNGEVK